MLTLQIQIRALAFADNKNVLRTYLRLAKVCSSRKMLCIWISKLQLVFHCLMRRKQLCSLPMTSLLCPYETFNISLSHLALSKVESETQNNVPRYTIRQRQENHVYTLKNHESVFGVSKLVRNVAFILHYFHFNYDTVEYSLHKWMLYVKFFCFLLWEQ